MGLFGCLCDEDVENEEDEEHSDSSEGCFTVKNVPIIIVLGGIILAIVGFLIPVYALAVLELALILGTFIWHFSGFGLSIDDIEDETKVRKTLRGYVKWRHNGQSVHRWVAEKYIIKRKLRKDEVVHHKDSDHGNNYPENLEVMTKSEHDRKHGYFWKRK